MDEMLGLGKMDHEMLRGSQALFVPLTLYSCLYFYIPLSYYSSISLSYIPLSSYFSLTRAIPFLYSSLISITPFLLIQFELNNDRIDALQPNPTFFP